MTPITAEFKAKLSVILNDKGRRQMLETGLRETALMVIANYKREMPVNKGEARNKVTDIQIPDGYIVRSTAMQNGRPYPLYISEGTGKYKNTPDQGYTSGYSRSSVTAMLTKAGARKGSKKGRQTIVDFVDLMKFIVANAKKRGKPYPINIRPNKFGVRAYNKSIPQVIDKFVFLVEKYGKITADVP